MLLGVIHNDHHMEGRCAVVDRIRAFFTYVPHVSLLPLECVLIKPYGGVSIIRRHLHGKSQVVNWKYAIEIIILRQEFSESAITTTRSYTIYLDLTIMCIKLTLFFKLN